LRHRDAELRRRHQRAAWRRIRDRSAGAGRAAQQPARRRTRRPHSSRDSHPMKLSRRAFGVVAAAASCLVLLGACSREQKDQRLVLGFRQIGAESEWRTANTESIKEAAATMNIDLRFADAQQKQENQIKALRSFIAQK